MSGGPAGRGDRRDARGGHRGDRHRPAGRPRGHAPVQLPLEGVTQLHADIGWLLAGLAVALVLGLRMSGAPPRAVRASWIMLAALGRRA